MVEVVEFISDDTRGFIFFASQFYKPSFVVGESIILGSSMIIYYNYKCIYAYESIIIFI